MGIGVNANVSRADIATSTTTVTVSKPTGTQNTDVLVAVFGSDTQSTTNAVTAPSGWTAITAGFTQTSGSNKVSLYGFWALGSVSALGFTNSNPGSGCQQGWLIVGFTGVDNTTPIDATGTTNGNTATANITANVVTVATANAWEVIAVAGWNGGTWTATGFTVKQNVASPPAANADVSLLYNTTPKGTGSTGTVSCANSASATAQILLAMPFALRPAASADVLMAQSCL